MLMPPLLPSSKLRKTSGFDRLEVVPPGNLLPLRRRKKKPKKDRITASDDSEVDTEEKETKPKRDTGFHVRCSEQYTKTGD